jgi:uncharacterized protein YjbI with pentapeptide repeats
MKKLILISALLFSFNGWAYNETDLAKLEALNACQGCDLSGANLNGDNLRGAVLIETNLIGADLSGADLSLAKLPKANLSGANLTDAILKDAKLDETIYCKTKMPWGELNDDCEE